MLFSSIEDAWRTPKTVENFTSSSIINCDYDCDELIEKILACKECHQKLLGKLNISNYSHEFEYLNFLYKKYIVNLNPKLKEKIINILLIIAVVLIIMIIQ